MVKYDRHFCLFLKTHRLSRCSRFSSCVPITSGRVVTDKQGCLSYRSL